MKIKKIISELMNKKILVIGSQDETILFAARHFVEIGKKMIETKGSFFVALSGGSTPKAIFEALKDPHLNQEIDWSKTFLFWSDERAVPPTSSESNYKMAMDAVFAILPIPKENIFRMKAESHIEEAALEYEEIIRQKIKDASFDLIMLGMGEDGHTASLFPETEALDCQDRLVVANYVSKLNAWRMTFTFECINRAKNIFIYVLGKSKSKIVFKALQNNNEFCFPIQKVGNTKNIATWILDEDAAEDFLANISAS